MHSVQSKFCALILVPMHLNFATLTHTDCHLYSDIILTVIILIHYKMYIYSLQDASCSAVIHVATMLADGSANIRKHVSLS